MGFLGSGISMSKARDTFLTIDATIPKLVIADAAPGDADIPEFVGQIYLDKTGKKAYIACGTESKADYVVLN